MRKIKKIIALTFSVIITFNLFGCSVSMNQDVTYEIDKAHITCAWWGNDNRNEYTMDAIEIFREKNSDISVDCKYGKWGSYVLRQNIYMKSGEEPDVMLINYNWIDEYSSDGNGFYNLYELSEYIDLSGYSKESLSYGEVNGKLNAIPTALNSQVIYYNKNLLDKYNLEIPKTWDDFFEVAEVLDKDNICLFTMSNKSLFLFLISYFEQTTGKRACNDKGDFILEKEDIAYMLKFYKELIDKNVVMPIERYNSKSFSETRSAGVIRWASSAESYFEDATKAGTKVVVGDYPKVEGVESLGWYIKPATMYAISNETLYPVEAAKLLNFLVNSEDMARLQKTEKGIPLSKAATEVLGDEIMTGIEGMANQKIIENQKYMKNMPYALENDSIYATFQQESDYYLYGKDTLEGVTDKIYNAIYDN